MNETTANPERMKVTQNRINKRLKPPIRMSRFREKGKEKRTI